MGGSPRDKQKRQQKHSAKRTAQARSKKPAKIDKPRPAAYQLPLFDRPSSFENFGETANYTKYCVYAISRIRTSNGQTSCTTLGTGFLAGRARLMTCAHVINSQEPGGDKHRDGDVYCIAQRNEDGTWYKSFIKPVLNETLFVYEDVDMAVIYLPDDFYTNDAGEYVQHPDRYLELARTPLGIGTDVGVLGYPMQAITFTPDGNDVDIGNLLIRADRGVINTRYIEASKVQYYDFTLSFNPGNSGGPIVDVKTGRVIGMVHGYNSVPIHVAKEMIPIDGGAPQEVLSVIRALYSKGLDSRNYLIYEKLHGLAFL